MNDESSFFAPSLPDIPPPPVRPLPAGRKYYLPEYFYLREQPTVPLNLAARTTARTTSQWADRYRARSLSGPPRPREGRLPESAEARMSAIDAVFDWLESIVPQKQVLAMGLDLFAEDHLVLDQYDGFPGVLALSEQEFADLQGAWIAVNLPDDLYYVASSQREVVEPTETVGGVAMVERRYTPIYWEHRQNDAISSLRIPSEDERRATIADEFRRFSAALRHRMEELSGEGLGASEQQMSELSRLQEAVTATLGRYEGFGADATGRSRPRRARPPRSSSGSRRSFSMACDRFLSAMSLRKMQLREPGKAINAEELRDLSDLTTRVVQVARAGAGSDRLRAP